jgi:uncharacterized protein YjcR
MHGGCSTGAPKGNTNALKHGRYTQDAKVEMKEVKQILGLMRKLTKI